MRSLSLLLALTLALTGCTLNGGQGDGDGPGDASDTSFDPDDAVVEAPAEDPDWRIYSYAVEVRDGDEVLNGTWDVALWPGQGLVTVWTDLPRGTPLLGDLLPGTDAWDAILPRKTYPIRDGSDWRAEVHGITTVLTAEAAHLGPAPGMHITAEEGGPRLSLDLAPGIALPINLHHETEGGAEHTWTLSELGRSNLTHVRDLRIGHWYDYAVDYQGQDEVTVVVARQYIKQLFGQDRPTYRLDPTDPEDIRHTGFMSEVDGLSWAIVTGTVNTFLPQILPGPFHDGQRIATEGSAYGRLVIRPTLAEEDFAGGWGTVWAFQATQEEEVVASWAYSPKARWLTRMDLQPAPEETFDGASWRLLDFGTGFQGDVYEFVRERFTTEDGTFIGGSWDGSAGPVSMDLPVPDVRYPDLTTILLEVVGTVPDGGTASWNMTDPTGQGDASTFACNAREGAGGCFINRFDPHPYQEGTWELSFDGPEDTQIRWTLWGRVVTRVPVGADAGADA